MPSVVSIGELPLIAELSPAECQQLESRMRRREFTPQQLIVREGGPGDAAFLVIDGLVAVRHKDQPDVRVDPACVFAPGPRRDARG